MAIRGEYVIKIDEGQRRRLEHELRAHPRDIAKVITRAVNRTGTNVRTLVIKTISQHVNIKQKDIRGGHTYGGVTLRRASRANAGALVRITGRRIPLFRFGARPSEPGTRPPGGVSYAILRGQGRKRIREAFIASGAVGQGRGVKGGSVATRGASGHLGIFYRPTPQRLPIKELFGPSITKVAEDSPELARALKIDVTATLEKNIDQQLRYVLLKRQGAARG